MTIKLYEFPPTRSIRVRWTLQELDVPFEAIRIDMLPGGNQSAEFLKLNPAGKLPVLVDGEMVLTESVAIALYLGEKYPKAGFIPKDPVDRAALYRWLFFTVTELEPPLWRIAKHTALYPEEKRLTDEPALAAEDFAPMVQIAERHMRGRTFVVGDGVTVADFVLAYTLDWAQEAGLLGGCSSLRAYVERMYARPHAPMRIAEAFASMTS